jgi:hypothetical protein
MLQLPSFLIERPCSSIDTFSLLASFTTLCSYWVYLILASIMGILEFSRLTTSSTWGDESFWFESTMASLF